MNHRHFSLAMTVFILFGKIATTPRDGWNPELCPIGCVCVSSRYPLPTSGRWINVINCSSSGLEKVPNNISSSGEALILSYNSITCLRVKDTLRSLKYLDVSSNVISSIDNKLQTLTYLKTLNLHNNSLSRLQNGQFSGLKYLATLDLSDNSLHSVDVEPHVFGGLNYLQKLHLEGNKLMHLEKQWFYSMPSLRQLFLSRNSLRTIPGFIFETLYSLSLLKINYNQIHYVEEKTFNGAKKLVTLDMSFNRLAVVPNITQMDAPSLQYLYLDGNPIYRLQTGAFHSQNLTLISACYMPQLTVVEKHAFIDMPRLITLQLHDNVMLKYLDRFTFKSVPLLSNLYIHNNALVGLPFNIRQSLPSLQECHFYNNALLCDCNAFWIKSELSLESRGNYTSVMYDDSVFVCDSPPHLSGSPLKALNDLDICKTCAPVIIPVFNAAYTLSVGEELRMECHALGEPEPVIEWDIPKGLNDDRIEVINNATLVLRHARVDDGGIFTCKASNIEGNVTLSSNVTIINKPIRLVATGKSKDYITVAWNGSTYRSLISDYQIHYRQVSTPFSKEYNILHLGAYTKRYTISNLLSSTPYELCMVYVYSTELYYVDCINVTTTANDSHPPGITNLDKRIVLGLCVLLITGAAFGCMITLIRRFHNPHQTYKTTLRDEATGITGNIPLDNMYNTTDIIYDDHTVHHNNSHAMYSSKTALISAQD